MTTYEHEHDTTRHTTWTPKNGVTAVAAGIWWDAIRVNEALGMHTLRTFQACAPAELGPVLADFDMKTPSVYFLTSPGTAAAWCVTGTRALSRGSFIVIPSTDTTAPPGPHWLVRPQESTHLTPPGLLRRFIATPPTR